MRKMLLVLGLALALFAPASAFADVTTSAGTCPLSMTNCYDVTGAITLSGHFNLLNAATFSATRAPGIDCHASDGRSGGGSSS